MKIRSPAVYYAMMAAKQRFRESSSWFPVPCLISFFLVLILTAHVVLSTNPRAGQPANVLALEGEVGFDSAIWLSVVLEKNQVVVSDNYRQVFRWSNEASSLEELQSLVEHLKKRVETEVKNTTLSKKITQAQTKVVIAVDQNLKYSHFRPILYALAEAGISNYGFETLNYSADSISLRKTEKKIGF